MLVKGLQYLNGFKPKSVGLNWVLERAALTTRLPPQPFSGHKLLPPLPTASAREAVPSFGCLGQQLNLGLQVLLWQLED